MRPSIIIKVQFQTFGGRRGLACVCLRAFALLYAFPYKYLLNAFAYISNISAFAYIDGLYVIAYMDDWRLP